MSVLPIGNRNLIMSNRNIIIIQDKRREVRGHVQQHVCKVCKAQMKNEKGVECLLLEKFLPKKGKGKSKKGKKASKNKSMSSNLTKTLSLLFTTTQCEREEREGEGRGSQVVKTKPPR